jgi:hypothetical protein
MIGLLRAIFEALHEVLTGQDSAAELAVSNKASTDLQLAALSAAIEHLRTLVEDDTIPTTITPPTFTEGAPS